MWFCKSFLRHGKKEEERVHRQETKYTIKPGWNKNQTFVLSGNITTINRLKALVEKLDNKYEHIKNFSTDENHEKENVGGSLVQDDNAGKPWIPLFLQTQQSYVWKKFPLRKNPKN